MGHRHTSLIQGEAGAAGGATFQANQVAWTPDEDLGTTLKITGAATAMVVNTANISQLGRFINIYVEDADDVNFIIWGNAVDIITAPGDYKAHYDGIDWYIVAMPSPPFVKDGVIADWGLLPNILTSPVVAFKPGHAKLYDNSVAGTYVQVECDITINSVAKTVDFEIGTNQPVFDYHMWISP